MGDYSGSADAGVPAGQLFGYLSEVSNLPRYFTAMTSAEPAGQDAVHVVADVDGVTREGEAWFRVDRERRHLEWESEGPDNYHGWGGEVRGRREIPEHRRRPRRNQAAGGSGPGARSGQLRNRPGATAEQGHDRRALPPAVAVTARHRSVSCRERHGDWNRGLP